MDRGAWWATVHGVTRVGHDLVTELLLPSVNTFIVTCVPGSQASLCDLTQKLFSA